MSINVTYPADYPAVEVCGPNPSLARLLNNDLSAAKSEMTAIHQYTYQAWRLEKDYPEISKTLSEIAMVEMRHFHRLGQLISLLGGTPKFFSCQRGITLPWNGKMVDYTADIHKLLKIDIVAEEAAYITYTRQSQCVKDAKVAANLARIAQDEKLHKAVLNKFLQDLSS